MRITVIRPRPKSLVYVDPAIHPYGRMIMCHMFSRDLDALHAMADRIGIARRWFQQPPKASWQHYDISKGKRALAVNLGAIETDRYEATIVSRQQRLDWCKLHRPELVAQAEEQLRVWTDRIKDIRSRP